MVISKLKKPIKMKTVIIKLCAGTSWQGQVLFQIKNPFTNFQMELKDLSSIKTFCEENGYEFDESLEDFLHQYLFRDKNKGWLVPQDKLGACSVIDTEKYLRKIQKDFF